ncbi:MAG TPA: hypothetical protein VN256_23015 [Pyrinomonadaceae bacterium]|nr:hypothetical protein [Pyrinomonadaceae bacterium]
MAKSKPRRLREPEKIDLNIDLREILEGGFVFRPDLHVSANSSYGDAIWNWNDPTNERLETYSPDRLTIDWPELASTYDLTEEIIADLRKYSFLRYSHSRAIFPENTKGNAHPATVINEIILAAKFISHLRRQLSEGGVSLIDKLSDIEPEDLGNALSTYRQSQHQLLKKVLTSLCSPALGRLLGCGPLRWNQDDVRTLDWKIEQAEPYARLEDGLFRFLSNEATTDVKQFLWALGVEPQDRTVLGEGKNKYLSAFENFKELFEEYMEVRAKFILVSSAEQSKHAPKYRKWYRSRKKLTIVLSALVERARVAAQLLVAMYTGARPGELKFFKMNCLRRDDDGWYLAGTVLKRMDLNAPPDKERWVAIPIVRDAVAVLGRAASLVKSPYLFHGSIYRGGEGGEEARKIKGVNLGRKFEDYLRTVDEERRWPDASIYLYMFRHSLAYQMRKAGLNLPFITFQLKHSYDALQRRIGDATLGYGGIGADSAQKAIQAANLEFTRQIYHPDAPVAGGGAEQLKMRRAAYFKGMAIHEVDDELRQLAMRGSALADVGVALCQGQKEIVVDGVKEDPPCMGQLRCNPVRCSNGIIPAFKLPLWERVEREGRIRAADPEFAHAKAYHNEAADEAAAVIRLLRKGEAGEDNGEK